MKAFEYAAPATEKEVLQLLSPEPSRTEILAGGTDLVGLLKKLVVTPDRVVNIMEVESLKSIQVLPGGGVSVGTAVTLDVIAEHSCLDVYPAVRQAIHGINSMQLQCQGTLGGELLQRPRCWYFRQGRGLLSTEVETGANRLHAILGNSGPAKFVSCSRIAPALMALGAEVRVIGPGPNDEKRLPLADLFQTPQNNEERENTLLPNQLVTHIILPPVAGRTCATYEVRHGEGPEFPLAAAAAALRMDHRGVVETARVVMGQVAPIPWLSSEAEQVLLGRVVDERVAEQAGEAAVSRATPLSENTYKVQLAKVAVKRAILLAAGLDCGDFRSHARQIEELV